MLTSFVIRYESPFVYGREDALGSPRGHDEIIQGPFPGHVVSSTGPLPAGLIVN